MAIKKLRLLGQITPSHPHVEYSTMKLRSLVKAKKG
jgi:hypothetical protein